MILHYLHPLHPSASSEFSVSCSKASSLSASACLAPPGSSLFRSHRLQTGSSHIQLLLLLIAFILYSLHFVKLNISKDAKQGVYLSSLLIYFNLSCRRYTIFLIFCGFFSLIFRIFTVSYSSKLTFFRVSLMIFL